ncbi:MAG: hypothetical protein ABSA46_01220 [Thermodesulfovibrionales bacterium]|jgi:hypothetical protein
MKKIAVIVRDRQSEALRMSIGLTILNDDVEIFVLDRALEETEAVRFNLDMIKEMGLRIFTNVRDNAGIEYLPLDAVADRLLQYDHVLPY